MRRFECLWLFDFKTGHEPVELLPGQLLYFQLISGPAEPALDFHAFIPVSYTHLLAIVKKVLDAHEAAIYFEQPYKKYTKAFIIVMPVK